MRKMSSFEQKIYKILKQENFSFVQEQQFKDCYNGLYRFDFYLPKQNVVIEVNGLQHYEYTKSFYNSISDFRKAQERDRRKIAYCLARKIKIYIIPFWEIDHIFSYKDIENEKFFVKTKFHNDEVWSAHQKNKDNK